jgi:hypothetical protein
MELIEYIVENLVDHPDDVRINEIQGSEENIVEIRVNEEDVGKVIGKNGSVAKALRTLMTAVGAKKQTNYTLEIID